MRDFSGFFNADRGPAEAHLGGRGRGGGMGGLFGFGGGFPFGNWGGGPPARPRAKRGDIRAGILVLLAEQPRNGYQIMQELEQRSRGVWRPSPGSVYPALQQLEDEGLVQAREEGTGRVYQLTEQGRKHVAEHAAETAKPWDWATSESEGDAAELMGQIRHIAGALWQITSSGRPEQIAQARKVMGDARRALYAILAEDGEGDE